MARSMQPVNARLVGWARIGVGFAAIVRGIDGIPVLLGLTDPLLLQVPYVSWMRPTQGIVVTLVVVWVASATAFTIGYRSRVAGAVLTLTIGAVLALDRQAYSNHLYLMMLLVGLLTVSNPGAALSVDAARGRSSSTSSGWGVFLLKCQVSIVYGFAALWKVNTAFLSGSVLASQLGSGPFAFPEGLRTPSVLALMSVAAVASEFTVAIGLWFGRSRSVAIALAVLLHGSIVVFMAPTAQLVVFAVELMILYPLFIGGYGRTVTWSESRPRCGVWVERLQRLDLFGVLRVMEAETVQGRRAISGRAYDLNYTVWLIDEGKQYSGFEAFRRIVGLLPATYLFAPFLGLPGVRHLGVWWLRRATGQATRDKPRTRDGI